MSEDQFAPLLGKLLLGLMILGVLAKAIGVKDRVGPASIWPAMTVCGAFLAVAHFGSMPWLILPTVLAAVVCLVWRS